MGAKDIKLDLEFEEEKKDSSKKDEVIDLDSTLVFGNDATDLVKKQAMAQNNVTTPDNKTQEGVKLTTIKINDQTDTNIDFDKTHTKTATIQPQPDLTNKLVQLDLRLSKLENENKEMLSKMVEAKLLDQKVTQLLLKINAKAPSAKPELQMIKKLLSDFIKKLDL